MICHINSIYFKCLEHKPVKWHFEEFEIFVYKETIKTIPSSCKNLLSANITFW